MCSFGQEVRALALIACVTWLAACDSEEGGACHGAVTHSGDLDLTSQAEVNALADQSPIWLITGRLFVTDAAGPILDLTPLHCLAVVEASASVFFTNNLGTLAGLENLKRVGRDLNISGNTALTDVSLPSLEKVEGSFLFNENIAFEDTLELPALDSVGGDVTVRLNSLLAGFSAPLLESAAQIVVQQDNVLRAVILPSLALASNGIDLLSNPNLQRVDLSALRRVTGGPLNIENDVFLSELRLDQVESLERGLRLINNRSLTALDLPTLQTVLRTLTIRDTDRLLIVNLPSASTDTEIDIAVEDNRGLRELHIPQVVFARSMRIVDNPALRTLNTDGLFHVNSLEIVGNHSLAAVDLPQLTGIVGSGSVTGTLRVESNMVLERLAIDGLSRLVGQLRVSANPRLSSCDVIHHAVRLGINDLGLTVEDNDDGDLISTLVAENQSELDAYDGVRCVRGSVTIGDLTIGDGEFTSFEALATLETVFESINLLGVESEVDLELPRLIHLGGVLAVNGLGETGLTGVSRIGLPGLESAGGLILSSDGAIRRLEAPVLVDIRGSVLIRRMTLLEELQLPALRSVEGITSQCNPRLHISVLEHIIEALEVPSALLACGVPGAPDCVLAVDELTC